MGRYPLKLYLYKPDHIGGWQQRLLRIVSRVQWGHVALAIGPVIYYMDHKKGMRICSEEAVHKVMQWDECLFLEELIINDSKVLDNLNNEEYKQSSAFYATFWYHVGRLLKLPIPNLCSTETCVILQKLNFDIPKYLTADEIKEWLYENDCIRGSRRRWQNDYCA